MPRIPSTPARLARAIALMMLVAPLGSRAFGEFTAKVSESLSTAESLPPAESLSTAVAPSGPELIMGGASIGESRLVEFFMMSNPCADRGKISRLAALYVEEASFEGVNPDIAFAQMCLETGFFRFGGLVSEDMNNFCGLGATGPGVPGHSFPDERTGVRAQVQHLKAYGCAEPLRRELVDPRFDRVIPRGKSPTIYGLSGTWAADLEYGDKLAGLIERMYSF